MASRLAANKRWGLSGDFIRFLVAGALNAGLTLLMYEALLFITPHQIAYSASWLTGVLFVMILYPDHVFRDSRKGLIDRTLLGTSYVVVFVFGLIILNLLAKSGISPRCAIFIVMAATTAVNFVSGRLLLRRR